MNGGDIIQDTWSANYSQNKYVTLTGTWTSNRPTEGFEDAFAVIDQSAGDGDTFDVNTSNGMQVKKDGRIIIDMQDTAGNMEPGNYTLKVTLKAEGKTFKIKPNGVISFTVVDAPKPN